VRRNVIDPEFIDAFAAEDQVFPHYPLVTMKAGDYAAMTAEIQRLVGGVLNVKGQTVEVSFDDMLRLVDMVPYDRSKPSSSWIPGMIKHVLEQQRTRCGGRAFLHTRKMNRRKDTLTTGALNGDELDELRGKAGPVFCAFRDDGTLIAGAKPFWYPTVVFDRGMPNVVVNITPND
jgi:hypothetical protein